MVVKEDLRMTAVYLVKSITTPVSRRYFFQDEPVRMLVVNGFLERTLRQLVSLGLNC